MAKNTRTYWYDYLDINRILNSKSNNGLSYYVSDSASQNSEQALQRVNEAFTTLKLNPGPASAVIPINLGNVVHGVYKGSHWVGVVIRRNPETSNLEAFYNDSLGTSIDTSLPNLRMILNNHGISNERITDFRQVQQDNGYDCGAWTVLNLDSLARTGRLPEATVNNIIAQRSEMFGYTHVITSDVATDKAKAKDKEDYTVTSEFHKNSDKFEKIKLTDDILAKVGPFKAITAQGKKRPTLDSVTHKALVHKKYDDARAMDDHITLFRVKDKKNLPPTEIRDHTVKGPNWTPPSSVSFVKGALSKGLRIWSATKPTNDKDGLLGDKGEPSIFARESMMALGSGWMARYTQPHEKYGSGRTGKAPVAVFTPPSSPRSLSLEGQRSIMDVDAGWDVLPVPLNNLIRLSAPLPKELTDGLKKSNLTRQDVSSVLLKFVVNTEGVLQLINKDSLSFAELNEAPIDALRELLQEEEVIELLSGGEVQFDELITIYLEYIDGSDNHIGEFSFQKLYSLLAGEQEAFDILFELNVSISDIIKLYNYDYNMFCAFVNDNAISFFQEYREEVDIEKMVKIYNDNPDLFYALINDRENVLQDTGVEEFIERYEQAQSRIGEMPEDDPYYGAHDAYDYMRAEVIEDNCPPEFLQDNNSSDDESYDPEENASTDEGSLDDSSDLNSSDDESVTLGGGRSSSDQSDYDEF